MSSPSEELQAAIYEALTADTDLMALISGVYDRVPSSPFGEAEGYISFGPEFTVYEDIGCTEVQEVNIQLDAWSRKVGRVHCKRIVAEARRVLLVLPELTGNALVLSETPLTRILTDPDGLTTHGIISLRYEVEAA